MKIKFISLLVALFSLPALALESADIQATADQVDQAIAKLEAIDLSADSATNQASIDAALRLLYSASRAQAEHIETLSGPSKEELIAEALELQKLMTALVDRRGNILRNSGNFRIDIHAKVFKRLQERHSFLTVSGSTMIFKSAGSNENLRYFRELGGNLISTLLKINDSEDPQVSRILNWGTTTMVEGRRVISMEEYSKILMSSMGLE